MDQDDNTTPGPVQVYLRVPEGRNLKAVESNGTSDPLFQIYVDGKSRKLESKHVVGTTSPTWAQEFVLGLKSSHSKIQLRLLDWNRFSSNKSLGEVEIDLSKLRYGTFYDDWRATDSQGELRVMIQLSKLHMPSPQSLNMKLPKTRLHLERQDYYPGQTIRGCLAMGISSQPTFTFLEVIIEGSSATMYPLRYGQAMLFGRAAVLRGSCETRDFFKLEKGLHLFPFECTLPLDIPHTYESGDIDRRIASIGANVNKYRIIGHAVIAGAIAPRWAFADFRVLAHPNHAVVDPRTFRIYPSIKPAPVQIDVNGPPVAWCAESYSLNATIQNKGDVPIDHLVVRLKSTNLTSGKGHLSSWARCEAVWTNLHDLKVTGLPGFPIVPGQTWTGAIQFAVPPKINPTMLSTVSPLLQNGYHFVVKPFTSNDKNIKTCGSKKLAIAISDHYSALDNLEPPVEPEGSVGIIMSAPPPPDFASKIVPAPQTKPDCLEFYGGSFGSISSYPGAFKPTPKLHTKTQFCPYTEDAYPADSEWMPGSEPGWLDPARSAEFPQRVLRPHELYQNR